MVCVDQMLGNMSSIFMSSGTHYLFHHSDGLYWTYFYIQQSSMAAGSYTALTLISQRLQEGNFSGDSSNLSAVSNSPFNQSCQVKILTGLTSEQAVAQLEALTKYFFFYIVYHFLFVLLICHILFFFLT